MTDGAWSVPSRRGRVGRSFERSPVTALWMAVGEEAVFRVIDNGEGANAAAPDKITYIYARQDAGGFCSSMPDWPPWAEVEEGKVCGEGLVH